MRRPNPSTEAPVGDQSGAAVLEFILLGLVLLVPLVYLILVLGMIQGQSLGVEAGSRHIARAVALSADDDDARARADRVVASVVDEYGIEPSRLTVALECRPVGVDCPSSGATLIVTVRASVALPFVPPLFGIDELTSVPVEASSAQKVSRFWGLDS